MKEKKKKINRIWLKKYKQKKKETEAYLGTQKHFNCRKNNSNEWNVKGNL